MAEAELIQTGAVPKAGKDDRRDAIIAIAREAFAADGYAGTSMSSIAARLGGTPAAVHDRPGRQFELLAKRAQEVDVSLHIHRPGAHHDAVSG